MFLGAARLRGAQEIVTSRDPGEGPCHGKVTTGSSGCDHTDRRVGALRSVCTTREPAKNSLLSCFQLHDEIGDDGQGGAEHRIADKE
jgi:hypothetical protein